MWVILKEVEVYKIMVIHTTQVGEIILTSHEVEMKTKTKIRHKDPTNTERKEMGSNFTIIAKAVIKVRRNEV